MAARLLFVAAVRLAFGQAREVNPVPVYEAKDYVTVAGTHPNGVLLMVKAPNAQVLPVLHLKGSAFERGEAYGTLMAGTVAEFITKVFDDYAAALLQEVNLNGLPKLLQMAIKAALGELGRKVAAPLLMKALGYVRSRQNATVHEAHDSTTKVFDEIAGIAKGVCSSLGAAKCESEIGGESAFRDRLERINYLPELIRMSCSMMGATRSATTHGKLVQLRTLDFGAVPFSNYGMVVVHHKTDDTNAAPDAFATVSFPGFVSAVTGFNSAGLVQSEKVSYDAISAGYNTTCIKPFGVDVYGCIPGSYDGEAVPFVIRRIVETQANKAGAEDLIRAAKRTWHVYLGLGDSQTMDFDVVGYAQERIKVWTNNDISVLTNASHIQDVTFLDMHVQPEKSTQMHDTLKPLTGNMTGHLIASYVPHATGSGDVHHMVVDHGEGKFYVATGTTTKNGTYFLRKACDAPVLAFNLDSDIWTMPSMAQVVV